MIPEDTILWVISIELGNGLLALIDDEDHERVSHFAWRLRPDGYIQRTWVEDGQMKHELLHRFIMRAKDGEIVDHENGDRWDCRKENLRVATYSQNGANRRLEGVWKGIFQDGNRWKARIKINGESSYLGSFETPEEAALAYDMAARRLFGRFASLNFPLVEGKE